MYISKNIKSEFLKRDFLGPNINKLEELITNRLNEIELNNKNVSYRYILNKYDVEVMLCSRISVSNMIYDRFKDYCLRNGKIYGECVGDKIVSWGNFNSRYDETLYKVCYGIVKMESKELVSITKCNDFFTYEELDENIELYRGLSNWVVGKWKSLDENNMMMNKLKDWKPKLIRDKFFKF